MAMRSTGYAYCDHCKTTFASSWDDKPGQITHPTTEPAMWAHADLIEKLKTCPNAGKTFRQPVMEEVPE
jgi:hypothetical protein